MVDQCWGRAITRRGYHIHRILTAYHTVLELGPVLVLSTFVPRTDSSTLTGKSLSKIQVATEHKIEGEFVEVLQYI